ncbi:hypothetical protein V1477_014149 [Vespula maculifrons]|uniref:Uncharacterized protein n=1 Tax=Vespula maculifrons TaxID=7453 RepID=A0ABD2BK78_VESMC
MSNCPICNTCSRMCEDLKYFIEYLENFIETKKTRHLRPIMVSEFFHIKLLSCNLCEIITGPGLSSGIVMIWK